MQLKVIQDYEQELRSRVDGCNRSLVEWGYAEGDPIPDGHDTPSTDDDGNEVFLVSLVPEILSSRSKAQAALFNQKTLVESYVRELLTCANYCNLALGLDPDFAEEDLEKRAELEQTRKVVQQELPVWQSALWWLTGKRLGLPNSEEVVRDHLGRTTWVYAFDADGNGTEMLHVDYEDGFSALTENDSDRF